MMIYVVKRRNSRGEPQDVMFFGSSTDDIGYNERNVGGIAQLGERLNGIQEVMGSNPTISIK